MNTVQKIINLNATIDRFEKKIDELIDERKTTTSSKQKDYVSNSKRETIMNKDEKNKQGNNLINELDNIINSMKSIGFSAEKASEAAFKLGDFRQQLEIFSMRFGVNYPLVKKLTAMTQKAEEQLKQHQAFAYI